MHISTASTAFSADRVITARSMSLGKDRMSGLTLYPSMAVSFGFTGKRRLLESINLLKTIPPTFSFDFDAPMTAIFFGFKSLFNDAILSINDSIPPKEILIPFLVFKRGFVKLNSLHPRFQGPVQKEICREYNKQHGPWRLSSSFFDPVGRIEFH